MSRLIDADALTKNLKELCNNNCQYTEKQRDVMCRACLLGDALDAIEDAPTVESQPQWILYGGKTHETD